MKIFVTGVAGQLGHDVMNELIKRGHEGVGSDIQEQYSGVEDGSEVTKAPYLSLDITDKEAIAKIFAENDIDRVVKELQQYSNETCDFDAIFYTEQEMWDNIATRNLDNSSWGTPDTVSPDTYSSYDELYRKVKGHIDVLYDRIGKDQAHIVVYQQWHGDGSAINSDGKPAWEIYLLY